MGCGPSKQEQLAHPGHTQGAGGAVGGPQRGKLNPQLSEKVRHPSAIPGSFFDREHDFRQTRSKAKKAVAERREGPCRLKSGRAAWKDGWCSLTGHQLRFFVRATDAAVPPVPGASPDISLELVGAHLQLDKKQELLLLPAGGGTAVHLFMPDERQRDEWMVGLGSVPGLFRRVQDFYELGAAWGHGATCTVHECRGRYSGRRFALKSRLHKSREATQAMHNELRILQICAKKPHPAIPQLHDYFFDEDGSIELVMDLMEGGELFDHIAMADQLREHDARAIFKQVAEGVAHLHSLGIAHRDLKPQNLMYMAADEGSQVKIMDYDLARINYAPTWEGYTPCGTIHYMAPEIVQHQKYSQAVDMWSLGVILFILLTGRMPFDGQDSESIAKAIEAGRYCMESKLWGNVSEAAKDLVRHLLQVDPQQRLTAQQVLQHPWLTTELDAALSAELTSPGVLRNTLSKTERGRQLLALAALAYSEGDLRQPQTAAAKAMLLSRKMRQTIGHPRMSAVGEVLKYDMQPVRDQAGVRRGTAAQGGGDGTLREGEEADVLQRLRTQLDIVGTAGGLQDRQSLELWGRVLLPASPRHPEALSGPAQQQEQQQEQQQAYGAPVQQVAERQQPQQQQRQQRQQRQQPGPQQQHAQGPAAAAELASGGAAVAAMPTTAAALATGCRHVLEGGLADLGVLEVEEQELSDSEANADVSGSISRRSSQAGGLAAGLEKWPSLPLPAGTASGLPPLGPLRLRLPPETQLPADRQLLEQLEHPPSSSSCQAGRRIQAGMADQPTGTAAAAAGGGGSRSLKRVQSAHAGAADAAMVRSVSTSLLKLKDRLPLSEREPVDLAMQRKQARLDQMCSPSGQRRLQRLLTGPL